MVQVNLEGYGGDLEPFMCNFKGTYKLSEQALLQTIFKNTVKQFLHTTLDSSTVVLTRSIWISVSLTNIPPLLEGISIKFIDNCP